MRLPTSPVSTLVAWTLFALALSCGDDASDDAGAAGAANTDAGNDAPVGQDAAGDAEPDAGSGTDSGTDAGHEDAAADATTEAGPDTQAIEKMLSGALPDAPAGVSGMSLIVHDANDQRIVEVTVGDFETDRRVPIASASKLVTGLVLLRLVEQGSLQMTDTPGTLLGWTGTPAANASLDHLGAFVSGLEPDPLCLFRPMITLQECAAEIGALDTLGAPGDRFDYGGSHQAVAAAMAEEATGQSWADLFEAGLKTPLGLDDPDLRYVTLPKKEMGGDNPLVAGGLLATADEYMPMLAVLFHKGEVQGQPWIASGLVERMGENHYTEAEVGTTPPATVPVGFRYSWSSWLNCEGPVESCAVVSSPGAYGFSPWIDWDAGYYAVLAMESDEPGGSEFAVPLMEALRPEIEKIVP